MRKIKIIIDNSHLQYNKIRKIVFKMNKMEYTKFEEFEYFINQKLLLMSSYNISNV